MSKFLRNPAILLHARKMAEADLNVVLFTANYGKIDAKARGVRRPRAKLRSLNSPLANMVIELAEGKKIPTITGVKIQKSRKNLSDNLEKVQAGMALCELIEKTTKTNDPHPEIFRILEKMLDTLETSTKPKLVFVAGSLQILQKLGFLGSIQNCTNCGTKISSQKIYFAPQGLSCEKCATLIECPLEVAKILLFLTQCHECDIEKIRITDRQIDQMVLQIGNWINESTGKTLKSWH
jgi:DNA repair protein RecO (recombination protein O)